MPINFRDISAVSVLCEIMAMREAVVPSAKKWERVVQVIDIAELPGGQSLRLYANTLDQEVLCYFHSDPE